FPPLLICRSTAPCSHSPSAFLNASDYTGCSVEGARSAPRVEFPAATSRRIQYARFPVALTTKAVPPHTNQNDPHANPTSHFPADVPPGPPSGNRFQRRPPRRAPLPVLPPGGDPRRRLHVLRFHARHLHPLHRPAPQRRAATQRS